jgi:integrase
MYGCGLRIAEVPALRPADFTATSVRVSRQVQAGWMVPLKHRVAGQSREVPLPACLPFKVRQHVREHGSGALFTISYASYLKRFKALALAAGCPAEYSPHYLRHAYASVQLGAARCSSPVSCRSQT